MKPMDWTELKTAKIEDVVTAVDTYGHVVLVPKYKTKEEYVLIKRSRYQSLVQDAELVEGIRVIGMRSK